MKSIFVPISGACTDFDEWRSADSDGKHVTTARKLEFNEGLLGEGRLYKFFRDELTLTYAQMIGPCTFELEYSLSDFTVEEMAPWIGVHLRFLSLKAGCRLSAPCYTSHSLTRLAQLDSKEIEVGLLNGKDQLVVHKSSKAVTAGDLDWTAQYANKYLAVLDKDEHLTLAFLALDSERFAVSSRMALMTLWSGLEGLFGIEHELTFRLSLMTAYFLETGASERQELFEEMKKAYAIRSAVTHGRRQKPEILSESVEWVASILRRCLLRSLELGKPPTTEALFFS